MSRNGTMTSNVSAQAFQQQQQNLQQLHALEQNFNQQSKSFTNDTRMIVDVLNNNNNLDSNQALSRNNYELKNPLIINVPINSNPTEILAGRFSAWRSIITSLIQYLNEIVSIQDEIVRQQVRLSHAVNFPIFNNNNKNSQNEEIFQQNFFLPQGNGSIHDLPNLLINYHSSSANLASKGSKELNTMVIPRLEDLKRELLVKIKEIKSLSSDFKTKISKELSQTKIEMSQYLKSIEDAKFSSSILPQKDPYLTKILIDKQIKRQIIEENYLHEAYINLQSSGKELEKVVVIEIQNALTTFAKVSGEQVQNVFDKLITSLDYGFLTKSPSIEWDQFINKDKNFIPEDLPKRDFKQIHYENDPLTYEVRSSFLERRSKFLKSYSRGYYVLTPTFFHEFKSADRRKDLIPVLSLSIDEIELEDHSRRESNQFKFVLKKVGKLSSHKYIFRSESYETMLAWYNDIKNLKSLSSPLARGEYAMKNTSSSLKQNSIIHDEEISRINSIKNSRLSIDDSFDERVLNNNNNNRLSSNIRQSIEIHQDSK